MNKRLIITILAVAALAIAAVAVAQGPSALHQKRSLAKGFPGCESPMERLQEKLDLTDAQTTAIEAIQDQAREQGVELRKQQARLQNEIDGEMLADEPSEKQLVDITEKLGALRTQLKVIRLKARLAVRAELTDEQRDQMLLMGERMGPRGQHRRQAPRADGERMRQHRRHRFEFEEESDDEI